MRRVSLLIILGLCIFVFTPCSQTSEKEEIVVIASKQETPIAEDKPAYIENRIICIDPGHGNPKIAGKKEEIAPNTNQTKPSIVYGTTGVETRTPEYKINMAVSLKLKDLLEEHGYKVILTRKSDEENLGNIARATIGNDAEANLVIRIHADGSADKEEKGVSVLIPGNKYISDDAMLAGSKLAAKLVLDGIVKATGAHPRGIVSRDDLTGFNWSKRPTILVEMGFLSNVEEEKLLNDLGYQNKIAQGIFDGAVSYFDFVEN